MSFSVRILYTWVMCAWWRLSSSLLLAMILTHDATCGGSFCETFKKDAYVIIGLLLCRPGFIVRDKEMDLPAKLFSMLARLGFFNFFVL